MARRLARRVEAVDEVIAELRQRFGERVSTAAAVREQHGKDESYHAPAAPDAVVFVRSTDEVAAIVTLCAAHKVPVIAVRHGHLARRPCGGARGRRLHRSLADEPGLARLARGSRLHGGGRRHPQAAQRVSARHRPVLPDRSGRRCVLGRHDGDARLGHQCGALRHDARERAGADGGAGRRARDPHRRGARANRRRATI